MITGPTVEVIVGKKRKSFIVPKDLICHHSEYFRNQFDPEAKLDLVPLYINANPSDFSLLVDFMYRRTESVSLGGKKDKQKIHRIYEIVKLADRLDLREAAVCIYQPLKDILAREARKEDPTGLITPKFIELVFRVTPPGNKLRSLIAEACLQETFKAKSGKFDKQLEELEGFAAESFRQIRGFQVELTLRLPLTGSKLNRSTD